MPGILVNYHFNGLKLTEQHLLDLLIFRRFHLLLQRCSFHLKHIQKFQRPPAAERLGSVMMPAFMPAFTVTVTMPAVFPLFFHI
ncbi:hypothetical protein D3C80_2115420 [compost metagenome]